MLYLYKNYFFPLSDKSKYAATILILPQGVYFILDHVVHIVENNVCHRNNTYKRNNKVKDEGASLWIVVKLGKKEEQAE